MEMGDWAREDDSKELCVWPILLCGEDPIGGGGMNELSRLAVIDHRFPSIDNAALIATPAIVIYAVAIKEIMLSVYIHHPVETELISLSSVPNTCIVTITFAQTMPASVSGVTSRSSP